MTSPAPQPTVNISGNYQQEGNSFTSINDIYRFFQPRIMKISRQSPPVLNVDVHEGEMIFDKTALRLYTVMDQTLRYVQFT